MKKILTSVLLLSFLFTFVASCKKDDKPKPTSERVLGKWSIQSLTENDHYSGQDHISVTPGDPGDFVDFRSDGKVYSNVTGYPDTSSYTVVSDTRITIDTDGYDIKTLTDNSFVLYSKDTYGSDYFEATISLKR
jgi:hypothetical protein